MIYRKQTELKHAAAVFAALLLAAAVLTGVAAAEDTSPSGGVYYYENVAGFNGTYKYLDNIIVFDGMNVLDAVSSYPEGSYSSTTSANGFILKKLDAEVILYLHDETNESKIISSFSTSDGGVVPRGSKVSFRISPNIPTAYSTTDGGMKLVGLKFISPNGTVASTYLGNDDFSASSTNWKTDNGLESKTITLDTILEEGEWTVFAYFVPSGNTGFFASYTPESYLNGTPSHFTISSSSVSLTVEPTTIQTGKEFTITVSGKPNEKFYLKPNEEKYEVKPGQDYFDYTDKVVTVGQTGSTKLALTAKSHGIFTLQLCSKDGSGNWSVVEDDCEIEIVRATLTAASEKASYYMGDDVTLTGTNESSMYPLYYYIEGKNTGFRQIPDASLKLTKTGTEWETTIKGSYISSLKFDTGVYTMYVSSVASSDKTTVTGPNSVVTTVTVQLIKPKITITSSPSNVIQDENLTVKGVAETASQVMYYIFGNNKHHTGYADVGRSGNYVIDIILPKDAFDTGQYYMVIQHPMYDGFFNVAAGKNTSGETSGELVVALNTTDNAVIWKSDNNTWVVNQGSQILFSLDNRQSPNAAQALCNAIDDEDIDDIYTKCSFNVVADATTVDAIPSQITKGMPFTVSGTAARVNGTSITVELLSTLFSPESKYSATSASFVTMVTCPAADGTWAVTFDTSNLNADTYSISVSANAKSVYQAGICVVDSAASVEPQKETPSAPAAVPTKTPTPGPKTPGFGAAALLAGLGCAALLLRGRRG